MQFYYLYIAVALIVALVYMLFDVLNRREVPNLFVYPVLILAFVLILLSGNWHLITITYLIAFAIIGFGYFVYRLGQLGLGDVFEFATLALLLAPISAPLLRSSAATFSLPSVLSLLLNTGIAAIVAIPLFYVVAAARRKGMGIFKSIRQEDGLKAIIIVASYLLFAVLLLRISYSKGLLLALIFLIIVGSALLILFQRVITEMMVDYVGVSGFTEDDIIAFNLMDKGQIESAKKRISAFDRLVTRQMIAEMKKKKIKERFPVYKRAIPFAVPIFLGTILTILLGNLLLIAILG